MEKEMRLMKECRDEYYSRGFKDKKTGEPLTRNSNVWFDLTIQDICRVKAELYAEGYRVEPFVEEPDLTVIFSRDKSGLKTFHKEVLREMK